ncbi:MAG: mechanosensitive ion channel domain-containing protein [Patescibacteria group bacterium]
MDNKLPSQANIFKKIINFLILSGIAGFAWFLNFKYEDVDLTKIFYSFIAIAVSYLFLKLILEGIVSKKIKESKARYSFRKTTQLLFIISSFIIILRIWIVNPQALLVAYGLVAAGVAIALQDVFKNFAGAFTIFLTGIYRVGDRIEVNSKYGDVIDIGLFYTTLLELRTWVDGDQATGRITLLPNGQILSYPVHNYTKDHNFIWDEITLPITYTSDWKKAIKLIQAIVKKETYEATKRAEREISQLEEKYYLSKRNIEPAIFITPTDNWITFRIRYVVDARERRIINNKLAKLILNELRKAKDVKIASQTVTITTAPSL